MGPWSPSALPARWDAENPWSRFHSLHGGDYPGLDSLPPPACEWHSSAPTAAARLCGQAVAESPRVVHWAPLDHAPERRTLVRRWRSSPVSSKAEPSASPAIWRGIYRITASARSWWFWENRIVRRCAAPADCIDLSEIDRSERAAVLAANGARSRESMSFTPISPTVTKPGLYPPSGIPVMATVHNSRAGWPQGWESLENGDVALLLACSQAVEAELRESLPDIPVRTVWNGIRPNEFPDHPRKREPRRFHPRLRRQPAAAEAAGAPARHSPRHPRRTRLARRARSPGSARHRRRNRAQSS